MAEPLKTKIRRVLRLDRAVRIVWDSAPGATAAGWGLTVLSGLLPLAALYLMKLIVDSVVAGIASPDREAAFRQVLAYVLMAGGVALAAALVRSLQALAGEVQGQLVTDHLSDLLHAQSAAVDLEYYENPKYYDTLHRAQQEAHYRPVRIVQGLGQVAGSGLSLLVMAGLLLSLHWAVSLVLFAAAAPGLLVRLRHSARLYEWERRRTESERKAWYYHWLLTDGRHAKEVRLFDLAGLIRGWHRDLRAGLRAERLKLTRRRSAADFAAQGAAALLVFSAYAFITYRAVQGEITLGDLAMYFAAFQRGLGALQELLGGLAGLYEDNLFLANLEEFLALTPKVRDLEAPRPVPRPMRQGLAFEGVGFTYPAEREPVLKDVSLAIKPGEVVALVGANGAGKTTLVKLLCRLYDPGSGRITLDGEDLRSYAAQDLRSQVAVVFQDYVCYYLTARDNVWLGRHELSRDDPRLDEAARRAGAQPLVERLPRGWETVLGLWFEDAHELSAGEWQKLALARAFLRDAQVVVLDEPTASLDPSAEQEVFARFRELLEGRSAVLISHRLSTVKMADTIYVLEGGRVVESGSHDQLMERGGAYAGLYETQARNYR